MLAAGLICNGLGAALSVCQCNSSKQGAHCGQFIWCHYSLPQCAQRSSVYSLAEHATATGEEDAGLRGQTAFEPKNRRVHEDNFSLCDCDWKGPVKQNNLAALGWME